MLKAHDALILARYGVQDIVMDKIEAAAKLGILSIAIRWSDITIDSIRTLISFGYLVNRGKAGTTIIGWQ